MQNKFGLKDFILIVLIGAVGLSVWLAMVQEDRRWKQVKDVSDRVLSLESQLSRVESSLKSGGGGGVRLDPAEGPEVAGGSSLAKGGGARLDESWAVPGVPIEWQPRWTYSTDPRGLRGFQEGGTFTECFDARPQKVTPHIQTDVYGRRVVDIVMEPLGSYDPQTLKMRGLLAEAWQMDPAGLWMRVRIRDEARFSDGKPVTAEDFRWTWHDYIDNPEIEAQRSRSIYADVIDRVEVVSERVVEFKFKAAFFSNAEAALVQWPLPKHFYSRFSAAQINQATGLLMGSGPFKMKQLDPDDQWTPEKPLELVRNEQYWGDRSPLASIRYITISDEQSRLVAYVNGDSDLTTPSAPQFVSKSAEPEFAKNNQCLNWVNMRSGNAGIAWNCGLRNGKPTPFADKRVRLAMTHLLDREKMIRDIWKGVGVVGKGSFLPASPASDPNLKPWPYDLAKAKALLKEAGWQDRDGNGALENEQGQEFQFQYTYFTGGEIQERIALFVQDACAAVGIKAIPNGMEWSVGDPIRKQRNFDAMVMGWGANAPESDPKQIYHSESIKDQGDNFTQWSNAAADKAIDLGRKELDFDKRMEHWRAFERVLHEEQPWTWIRVSPFLRFVKPEIGNVNMYKKGLEPWEFFRGGPSGPGNVN